MRGLVVLASLLSVTLPASAAGEPPEGRLIPRTAFFGNPTRAATKLSHDGKWLSWEAARNGVLNVFIAPADHPDQGKPLTDEKLRPVPGYSWSPDSSMILYGSDTNGDENTLLYGIDIKTGEKRALTPLKNAKVTVQGSSRRLRQQLLIGINNRDARYFDIYDLNLQTGKMTPVFLNKDNFSSFISDDDLKLRIAGKSRPDGGTDLYRFGLDGKPEAKPYETIAYADDSNTGPLDFSNDGKILYWFDSRGRDTAALIAQDVATGKKTILAEDPKADIGGLSASPETGRLDGYATNYDKTRWHALDPAVAGDFAFLNDRLKGQFGISSRTDDDATWLVTDDPVVAPGSAYRYDRATKTLTRLYTGRPELVGAPLAAMRAVEIKARDGLTLLSYLTLPHGTDPQGTGKPDKPLPLVLEVHGGPQSRDTFGYDPEHQWLANRGYAVLSVNFRGSSGLGKAFELAGNLQWGRKMQDDLDDAVEWAVKQGIADPRKVAIFGGSYGGYAVLAGLAFTPQRYACGVDLFGPSNLSTLVKTIPAYWESGRAEMARRMGDPATPEGQALLKERSPLFKAADIRVPLLIGQGGADPRVKEAESNQIAAAMKDSKVPVTYLFFPDEGHGFARPVNNLAFMAVAEQFLFQCLGGRAEPIGDVLAKSSAVVRMGGDAVKGLVEAAREARPSATK